MMIDVTIASDSMTQDYLRFAPDLGLGRHPSPLSARWRARRGRAFGSRGGRSRWLDRDATPGRMPPAAAPAGVLQAEPDALGGVGSSPTVTVTVSAAGLSHVTELGSLLVTVMVTAGRPRSPPTRSRRAGTG